MPTPDTWGGPMRALLFWWLLRTMSRQWWAQFLERYGQPFLKGKYTKKEDRAVLERAFRVAQKLGGIVVSASTEAEIVQAANTSGDHYKSFIECCNLEISKLIVGQTLSSNVQPTGLGSGVAALQGQVRGDLRRMDIQGVGEVVARGEESVQSCLLLVGQSGVGLVTFGDRGGDRVVAARDGGGAAVNADGEDRIRALDLGIEVVTLREAAAAREVINILDVADGVSSRRSWERK